MSYTSRSPWLGWGLLALSALLGPLPLEGQRPLHWSATDVALASGFVTATWIDVAQTHYFLAQGVGQEDNPIIGPHPSEGHVTTMASLGALGVLGTAAVLPSKWRKVVLTLALATEAYMVYSNSRIVGVGIRF